MPNILGALLTGAAGGVGAAEDKNVTAQNAQATAENVATQRAQLEDIFQQAKEQRGYEMAGRYRNEVIAPIMQTDVPKLLATQKLVPPGQDLTDEQTAAGWKPAGFDDVAKAQTMALTNHGINPEEAQKGGYQVADVGSRMAGMLAMLPAKIAGEIAASRGKGADAAQIRADQQASEQQSKERIADARMGRLTPDAAAKVISDPLSPPDVVEIARNILKNGSNTPPPGAPQQPGAFSTGAPTLDSLFPQK